MAATAEAADTAADIEDSGEAPAKKPKMNWLSLKLLIIGAAALAVLGGGGAFAYLKFFHGGKAEQQSAPAAKPAIFVDMPDVLVNLANSSADRPQYLKIKIVLEVPDQAISSQIQPLMPRVMDTFQTYLRELRATDLDGSVGLFRLREELTRRVNAVLAPGHVNAVLFKEIVIQ
jgi:flagellar FliL protein